MASNQTQFVNAAISLASSWAATAAGGCKQDDGGGSEDSNVNMDVANETPN